MSKAHTPTWEMEYKIVDPHGFGREPWTVCQSQEEAKFHLRNISNNLPERNLKVVVYWEAKIRGQWDLQTQEDRGKAKDIYRHLFGSDAS